MSNQDFSKEFFQRSWGPGGYYEEFTYGVGFEQVVQKCLVPFYNLEHNALEIGPGGGAFTKKMINRFKHLTAIDVIKMPEQFEKWSVDKFFYKELTDKCYEIGGLEWLDFVFSYNTFCHLSNNAISQYIRSVLVALKPSASFIFMLSNARNYDTQHYQLGDLLPFGHFYQDERTLDLVIGEGWEIVNRNMIPEHRDIIIHLKKSHELVAK